MTTEMHSREHKHRIDMKGQEAMNGDDGARNADNGGKVKRPCIECGDPDCGSHVERGKGGRSRRKTTAESRGYDSRWRRLAKRALKVQRFCSDCGRTDDLQVDHSPEAWRRREAGLAIRLRDVDVVCGDCNRRRGPARGAEVRRSNGTPGFSSEKGLFLTTSLKASQAGARGMAGVDTRTGAKLPPTGRSGGPGARRLIPAHGRTVTTGTRSLGVGGGQ